MNTSINEKFSIELLLCGGTIDKTYFPEREVFDFDKTHIVEMLSQARLPELNIDKKVLMLKDSLDMDEKDRERIALSCQESTSRAILIMHGTSTMIDTAKTIERTIEGGKVIILFGAMLPYELAKSDALFNLGTAIASCQLLTPGVYISMNGRIWDHKKVYKNTDTANFLSI